MKVARSAAIYARISKDLTGERQGVDRQLEDCRTLARERGWAVGGEYVDNDISAYSGRVRPEYRRLLTDVKAGERDGVITWHADRLHRSPLELEEYIEVCEAAGADTLTVKTGALDLSSASGRTIARIHGAIARGESERMSERMKRGNLQRAEQGRPATKGLRCYGYERDGTTIIETEAVVIRALAERFLAGEPLAALVRWLNDNEITTVRGGERWYNGGVRSLLRRGRLSGQCEYLGDIVAPGQWPAIITPEQTAAIRRILENPARKTERAPSRYLLTKLLRCGLCAKPLISHPRRDKPGYCCRKDAIGGCGGISINGEPLDEYIRDLVLDALDGPELSALLTARSNGSQDADQFADSIRADQARLLELSDAFADGELTREQLTNGTRRLTDRINANIEALAAHNGHRDLARYIGHGTELRERWETISLDRRRAVIRAVIGTVTITPATRRLPFDPDRVHLTWRV